MVAFFYGKDEYRDDIAELRRVTEFLSNRPNLRIALVTDTHLIDKMKKKHEHFFHQVGKSSMVLVRYDGFISKLDLSDSPSDRYRWWISAKSAKPVDQLSEAVYQLTQAAGLPMLVLFMDFESSDPRVVERSHQLLHTMEVVAPVYEHIFKVYYTSDKF